MAARPVSPPSRVSCKHCAVSTLPDTRGRPVCRRCYVTVKITVQDDDPKTYEKLDYDTEYIQHMSSGKGPFSPLGGQGVICTLCDEICKRDQHGRDLCHACRTTGWAANISSVPGTCITTQWIKGKPVRAERDIAGRYTTAELDELRVTMPNHPVLHLRPPTAEERAYATACMKAYFANEPKPLPPPGLQQQQQQQQPVKMEDEEEEEKATCSNFVTLIVINDAGDTVTVNTADVTDGVRRHLQGSASAADHQEYAKLIAGKRVHRRKGVISITATPGVHLSGVLLRYSKGEVNDWTSTVIKV